MNERNRENFVLDKAKNVGDAVASTRLFNAGQNKICRLQPFNVKQNKSIIIASNKITQSSLLSLPNYAQTKLENDNLVASNVPKI